jgi:hypothetical protein
VPGTVKEHYGDFSPMGVVRLRPLITVLSLSWLLLQTERELCDAIDGH